MATSWRHTGVQVQCEVERNNNKNDPLCSIPEAWTSIEIKEEPPDLIYISDDSDAFDDPVLRAIKFDHDYNMSIDDVDPLSPVTPKVRGKRMSNAESMRKYRQRLKSDPVRFAKYKERERTRNYRRRHRRIIRIPPERRTEKQKQIIIECLRYKELDKVSRRLPKSKNGPKTVSSPTHDDIEPKSPQSDSSESLLEELHETHPKSPQSDALLEEHYETHPKSPQSDSSDSLLQELHAETKNTPDESGFSAASLLHELFGDIVDVSKSSRPKEQPAKKRPRPAISHPDPSILSNRSNVQPGARIGLIKRVDNKSQNLAHHMPYYTDKLRTNGRPLPKPSKGGSKIA